MASGEWLTRATIWLALLLYTAGQVAQVRGAARIARALDTLGCAALLAHVVCAFQFYYHWSHDAASDETARRTAAIFGWKWGGGLYFNYAFVLLWIGLVICSWAKAAGMVHAKRWLIWTIRGFFLLMVANGAAVFVHSPMRWVGMLLCAILVACWWLGARPRPTRSVAP